MKVPPSDGSCKASVLLPKAKAAITVVVHSGAHFVSDSPYPKFLPELLAMVPSARYIQTTREPKVWAKSRISQHRHLLNLPHCKPEWVNVTSSYFNVFECVAAAGDAITRSGADEEVHCSRQIISGPGTRIRELLVDLRPSTGLRGRLPVAGQASADLRLGRWFCGSRWCQGEWRPDSRRRRPA